MLAQAWQERDRLSGPLGWAGPGCTALWWAAHCPPCAALTRCCIRTALHTACCTHLHCAAPWPSILQSLPRPGPSSNWLSWTPGSTGERIPARGASMDGPQTSSSACVAPILGWPPKITSSQPGFNVIRPGPVECVSLRRPQTRPDQGMAAGCPRGKGQQNNQK